MAETVNELLDELSVGLGSDASFFRAETDRLYLTGIEIAAAVAIGLVTSYFTGLYSGAQKRLIERGEQDGAKAIDVVLDRLKLVRTQIVGARKADEPKTLISDARAKIELIELVEVRRISLKAIPDTGTAEVQSFLLEIGYPPDIVPARAQASIQFIRSEASLARPPE